jgi:ethanolamine utilization protein EutN
MQLARIIGTATATVKHPSLAGVRLAIGQPLRHDREPPDGDPQLVIDTLDP